MVLIFGTLKTLKSSSDKFSVKWVIVVVLPEPIIEI